MLIKGIQKGGKAVSLSPLEALPYAVQYGLKAQNSADSILWADPKSVKVGDIHHVSDENGEWECTANGTAMIGKTEVATDRFHVAKPHSFKIRYKSSKDAVGVTDVKVIEFSTDALETNPANMVGPVDTSQAPSPMIGEIQAGGKKSTKVVS